MEPFLLISCNELETIRPRWGWRSKYKLSKKCTVMAIKPSYISHLEEHVDDFGNKYVVIHLNDACDIDCDMLYSTETLTVLQNYINNAIESL